MYYSSLLFRDTTDIHQWIKKVQEQSENTAERRAVETRTSSLLKKAEKEREEDEIELLKQKYLGSDNSRTREENHAKQYPFPSPSSSPISHQSPRNNNNVPIQKSPHTTTNNRVISNAKPTDNTNKKPLDALKSKYTKFGSKPPELEDYAFYGVDRTDMESHVERALNARDLDLVDFDHQPYESDWRRKFPNEKKQADFRTPVPTDREDQSRSKNPVSRRKPENFGERERIPETEHKKVEISKNEKRKAPRNDDPDTELSLVANFDPLAIEAHSLLHNWIGGNKIDISGNNNEDEEPAPLSRWKQLKAEIHNLEGPSMLIKQPPEPRSLTHHTVSSKRKTVPDVPKQEEKKIAKIPVAFDPRPKMEARHDKVNQMQIRRAELGKEEKLKKHEQIEAHTRAREIEEEKRRAEKQAQERQTKAMEEEMLIIKLRREEEASLIKEEEQKMLEAHKQEVQRKLRQDREKLELDEARRIEVIRKEEEEKRRRLKDEQNAKLAKAHSDKKILQKCISTWYLHVRELKLKLEKFKVIWEWKKINKVFKVWRRFAQNTKAEREANQYATRAKEEQRNLDRAVKFRDHRVTLRTFLIWRARAKLKGEQKQLQEQHELRKQQMAQFLQKVKQSPNTETPKQENPLPKQETPKSGVPARKVGPVTKASPNRPKLPDQASPNTAKSGPSIRRPSPGPRARNSPLPNGESGQSTPPNKGIKSEDPNVEKTDKNYTPPSMSRAYLEMEARAEERKNRRKELDQKYLDAQKIKEEKKKEEEDKEKLRVETEKQAKLEHKRLAKLKEAANKRQKEIEEQSEKMAIKQDEKRLLKFYCWLPWRKCLQNDKLQNAAGHFEKVLLLKNLRAWRERTKQIIEEKLQFVDEFYEDTLQVRSWKAWVEALRISRIKAQQAETFCNLQLQKRQFVVWLQKAKIAMEKRAAEDLRKEFEMEKYYSSAIVKKMWRSWRRFVIITKEDRKSEKRKENMRNKAHEWLQQYRQAKSYEK